MSRLIRTSNEFAKNRKRPLVFFYLLSFCWHISLFSVLYITFPNSQHSLRGRDVTFLGSFLNKYDIDSPLVENRFSSKSDKFFRIAKQNIISNQSPVREKLDFFLDKPKYYFFSQDAVEDAGSPTFLRSLAIFSDVSAAIKKDFIPFDENKLRPNFLQFKEGLPCLIRFNLDISERGRVQFLDKEITSGNFEVDLFVERAIRRLVFDTSEFGNRHNQKIELDFKNDSN